MSVIRITLSPRKYTSIIKHKKDNDSDVREDIYR